MLLNLHQRAGRIFFTKGGRKQLPDFSCNFCTVLPECPSTWRQIQIHKLEPSLRPRYNSHFAGSFHGWISMEKKNPKPSICNFRHITLPYTTDNLWFFFCSALEWGLFKMSFCWKTINPFVPNEWTQYYKIHKDSQNSIFQLIKHLVY